MARSFKTFFELLQAARKVLVRLSMRHPSSLNRNRSMRRTQRPSQRFPHYQPHDVKVDGQQVDDGDRGEQGGDVGEQQGDRQHLLLRGWEVGDHFDLQPFLPPFQVWRAPRSRFVTWRKKKCQKVRWNFITDPISDNYGQCMDQKCIDHCIWIVPIAHKSAFETFQINGWGSCRQATAHESGSPTCRNEINTY